MGFKDCDSGSTAAPPDEIYTSSAVSKAIDPSAICRHRKLTATLLIYVIDVRQALHISAR